MRRLKKRLIYLLALIALMMGFGILPAVAQDLRSQTAPSLEKLIATLRNENQTKRTEAAQAIKALGAVSIEPMKAVVNDPNWRVRYWAIEILSELAPEEGEAVAAAGLSDPIRFVRQNARRALARIQTDSARSLLAEEIKRMQRSAKQLIDDRKFAEAERLLENAEEIAQGNTIFAALTAYQRYAQGKFAEAKELYIRAIEQEPSNAVLHENLGRVHLLQENLADAQIELEKAAVLDTQSVSARHALAELYRSQEQLVQTERVLREIIAIEPKNITALLNLAHVLRQDSRDDEAEQAVRAVLTIEPENAAAWGGLGNSLFALGKYDEAIKAYEHSIRANPCIATHHNNLGIIFEKQGLLVKARDAYTKAIEHDGTKVSFKENQARVARAIVERR